MTTLHNTRQPATAARHNPRKAAPQRTAKRDRRSAPAFLGLLAHDEPESPTFAEIDAQRRAVRSLGDVIASDATDEGTVFHVTTSRSQVRPELHLVPAGGEAACPICMVCGRQFERSAEPFALLKEEHTERVHTLGICCAFMDGAVLRIRARMQAGHAVARTVELWNEAKAPDADAADLEGATSYLDDIHGLMLLLAYGFDVTLADARKLFAMATAGVAS